jgi:D-alanine--poly(phosphoribitol) ligase subunit 2
MPVSNIVLDELEKVTGTDEVRRNLDIELFNEKILDSFGTMELVVALSNEFSLELTPGQISREEWATPRKIITYLENRLKT